MVNPTISPGSQVPVTHTHAHDCCGPCFSWKAIIAAALVAVGLNFLLYLFTTGVGLSLFTLNTAGQLTLAITGLIWLIISTYFIMFLVGWIAAMPIKPFIHHRCTAVLHGFTAWSLALIITVALFSAGLGSTLGAPIFTPAGQTTLATAVTHTVAEGTKGTTADTRPDTPMEAKAAVTKTGLSMLAVFLVFLSSALGSIFGSYVASRDCGSHVNKEKVGVRKTTTL